MLISSTGTIHQRYHTAYREAVNVTTIHQYLCSKHGWTPAILSDVNWQWFKESGEPLQKCFVKSFDEIDLQSAPDT
jgi:hypothetical protein